MLMLFNDEPGNEWSLNKIFEKKNKKETPNYSTNTKVNEKEIITKIKVSMLEYFCCCCGKKKHRRNIEIFDFGVNFYKSQMSIINIFNIIFLK